MGGGHPTTTSKYLLSASLAITKISKVWGGRILLSTPVVIAEGDAIMILLRKVTEAGAEFVVLVVNKKLFSFEKPN